MVRSVCEVRAREKLGHQDLVTSAKFRTGVFSFSDQTNRFSVDGAFYGDFNCIYGKFNGALFLFFFFLADVFGRIGFR